MIKWRSNVRVLALVLGITAPTLALTYPERNVTIVVPATSGGVTDFIGRLLAKHLSESLKKPVVVENRPGGGTLIGANAVAKAAPDGHTMMVMPLGTLFNSIISRTMPIDFNRDLTPVSVVADQSLVLVVNASLPVTNVKELIEYARSRPSELSFGNVGAGSLPDIAAQLLMNSAKIKMVGIPYGGNTPAMTDLLAGRIHLLFLPLGSALPHIAAGKVRAIGVSSPQRDPHAPDIPSLSEGLPGYSIVTWQALMITGGTPQTIIDLLNRQVQDIIATPDILTRFRQLHLTRRPPSNAKADKDFILAEFKKWQVILRNVGLVKDR
jgi:tripartite-type tricarboxylate transporter receptor subunit TctC